MEVWIGAPEAISGASRVREQFIVSGGDRTVRSVSVRLNLVSGTRPLGVILETNDGGVIEQGTLASTAFAPGAIGTVSATWATYAFATPHALRDGQGYQLVLTAPADTLYQAYGLERGSNYGFLPPTFFGDGDGQFSADGGGWQGFNQPGGRLDNSNADLQFYFSL